MADASLYEASIQKYAKTYNQKSAEKIVGYLGIALRNTDSSIVACSDAGELDRVRDKWCRGKLGVAENQQAIDAAIAAVCEQMKEEGAQKCRVTFYYLLAERFEKLAHLAK